MISDKSTGGLRRFLAYYKPYRALLAADMLCALAAAGLTLILPICVRHITQQILTSGTADSAGRILRTGGLMVLIVLAQTACTMFYDYKGHDMGAKIERDMRGELFAHLQRLPFGFYDGQKTGELMSRLTNDLLEIAEMCHHTPEKLLIYGTQFFGSLIILFTINVRLTLVICAFLPFFLVYSFIFYKRMEVSFRENRERIASVNAYVQENLSGIRVVQSFANEKLEIERFARENQRFYLGRRDIYKKEMQFDAVAVRMLTPLITAAIVVFGGLWMLGGSLELSTLLVFVLYAAYMTEPVPQLAFWVIQFQGGLSGYRRFREIMQVEPEVKDAENARELCITRGDVTLENVSFKYKGSAQYVLKNITLSARSNETLALVGRSGIGKTTLCSLIPRFYDACGGEIRIDGENIRDVTLNSLRRQIGVVRQETFMFAGTVMENILYGNPAASREQAIEAAKRANAHEFISQLSNGYDTDIGQRGVRLSGGQQQRISIARVFLKDPPILILDEATSALDYENERAVMQSLAALSRGRTTLIIAHRLSTVRNADKIVVLSGDGIAEQGTHDELCAMGGEYAKLYSSERID